LTLVTTVGQVLDFKKIVLCIKKKFRLHVRYEYACNSS
jgi:hypothetical protein